MQDYATPSANQPESSARTRRRKRPTIEGECKKMDKRYITDDSIHDSRSLARQKPSLNNRRVVSQLWTRRLNPRQMMIISASKTAAITIILSLIGSTADGSPRAPVGSATNSYQSHNGFQLYSDGVGDLSHNSNNINNSNRNGSISGISQQPQGMVCSPSGFLTFELATGFIYKPSSAETLAMMPSTLQLTDCLDYCLHNSSCLAINFEMGLCVLLSSSAKQNPQNLYSSQFPVFTIYAEKKCLLQGDPQAQRQRHRCQRAWTFERVAGYEMKTRPRRRLKLASKEHCMEACLLEPEFECRSANWYRQTMECTLSDQDRHSVSQSEAGDQQIKASLHELYGPSNLTGPAPLKPGGPQRPTPPPGLYQNYFLPGDRMRSAAVLAGAGVLLNGPTGGSEPPAGDRTSGGRNMDADSGSKYRRIRQLFSDLQRVRPQQLSGQRAGGLPGSSQAPPTGSSQTATTTSGGSSTTTTTTSEPPAQDSGLWPPSQYVVVELPANAPVDYLENNCVYEPNKLCEFRKIQNRVLKTVDSIYQEVASLDECKQKCLNAPYRCYSFDYGDTSERVCRTSHLDQASLLSVKEPYLDVVGAITYELASCFNVSIQCRAREMVAQVSSSKTFRGKIYVKSRPTTCLNDVRESLQFELSMRYHDEACDVRASSNQQQGVFSNDIVIQHHDRIVTTQDVGLSVYCQYDLGNRSITNNVDLAIDRIEDQTPIESKTQSQVAAEGGQSQRHPSGGQLAETGSLGSPLTITSLATTVVRSPNVTMRITNMNGQPVQSATVGDRLALLFEIKEKSSPFSIFVREIIAMDGKQLLAAAAAASGSSNNRGSYHGGFNASTGQSHLLNEKTVESMFQANKANSVQFIDSDGCPTDANIMGPLIRMDYAGHRVLAPFDAFKFPTSDMVFFRAVVTSCVSECRPVICQSTVGGAGGAAAIGPQEAASYLPASTTTAASIISTTGSSVSSYSTTTTLSAMTSGGLEAAAANGGPFGFGLQQKPVASGPGAADQRPSSAHLAAGLLPSSTSRQMMPSTPHYMPLAPAAATPMTTPTPTATRAPLPALSSMLSSPAATGGGSGGSDSLTTIPGFGTTTPDSWLLSSSTLAAASNKVTSPKPTINNNDISGSSGPDDGLAVNKLGPINLNSLSLAQRQQIVKLFEAKLRQQLQQQPGNSNNGTTTLNEMADLYTNFLTSIMMLNGMSSGTQTNGYSNTNNNNNIELQADNYKLRQEPTAEQQVSSRGSPTVASPIDSRLADFESLIQSHLSGSQQVNGSSVSGDGEQLAEELVRAALISSSSNLEQQQEGDKQQAASGQKQAPRATDEATGSTGAESQDANNLLALTKTLNEVVNGASDEEPAPEEEMAVDSGDQAQDSGSGQQSEQQINDLVATLNATLGQTQAAQQTFDRPSTDANGSRYKSNQQRETNPDNSSSPYTLGQITSDDNNERGQETAADKLPQQDRKQPTDAASQEAMAANLQALVADSSYYGATYPSFGKRRKRRSAEDSESHESTEDSGHYLLLEQPQWATLAPSMLAPLDPELDSGDKIAARFTNGLVEIYPAFQKPSAGDFNHGRRDKREAQPSYDVDELVVQSIKILDRLQFHDEEPQKSGKNQLSAGRQNLARSRLVTRGGAGNQTTSIPPTDAANDLNDGSQADPTSSTLILGWSKSGALSLLIVAATFIFVQIFLVLVCLFEMNQRRKATARARLRNNRPIGSSTLGQLSSNPYSLGLNRCDSLSTLSSGASTLCLGSSPTLANGSQLDFGHQQPSPASGGPIYSPSGLLYSTPSAHNQISAVADFAPGDHKARTLGRRDVAHKSPLVATGAYGRVKLPPPSLPTAAAAKYQIHKTTTNNSLAHDRCLACRSPHCNYQQCLK